MFEAMKARAGDALNTAADSAWNDAFQTQNANRDASIPMAVAARFSSHLSATIMAVCEAGVDMCGTERVLRDPRVIDELAERGITLRGIKIEDPRISV